MNGRMLTETLEGYSMKKLLKDIWVPLLVALLFGATLMKIGEVVVDELKGVPLKPISEEWVLFVTEIEGRKVQIRVMEEDYEDFHTFLHYIGVPMDTTGRR